MSPRRRDLLIGIGTIAFFAVVHLYVIPNHIRVPANLRVLALSPAFWPTTVTIMGMVVGGLVTLRAMLGMSADDGDDEPLAPGETRHEWLAVMSIAVMFGYFALVPLLGIVLASMLAIPAVSLLFGERRYWWTGAVAIAVPLLMYGFFTRIVRLPLPMGIFERFL